MSEVVGYIIMFGILSLITVIAMLAFSDAQDGAQDRIIELRADSGAERVASVVVRASLFAERYGTTGEFEHLVELPEQLEGRDYTVSLQLATATEPERIVVNVGAISYDAVAPLFSAAAPSAVDLCPGTVTGGRIEVVFGPLPAACPSASPALAAGEHAIYLQESS